MGLVSLGEFFEIGGAFQEGGGWHKIEITLAQNDVLGERKTQNASSCNDASHLVDPYRLLSSFLGQGPELMPGYVLNECLRRALVREPGREILR